MWRVALTVNSTNVRDGEELENIFMSVDSPGKRVEAKQSTTKTQQPDRKSISIIEKWLPSYGCKQRSNRLKTVVDLHKTHTRASVEIRDKKYASQEVFATVCVDRQGKVCLTIVVRLQRCDK